MTTERQYPEIVSDLISVGGATGDVASAQARQGLVMEAHEAAQAGRFELPELEVIPTEEVVISPTSAYRSAVHQLTQLSPTDRSPEAIALRRAAISEASARAKLLLN